MRIVLPPLFVVAAFFSKIAFLRLLLSLRFLKIWILLAGPVSRKTWKWGHHVEEFVNVKTLLRLDHHHIVHEDGGEEEEIPYEHVTGILVRQWHPLSHGKWSWIWRPPYWVEIQYLKEFVDDGEVEFDYAKIEIWPRKVEGGLMRLMRVTKALQHRVSLALPDGPPEPTYGVGHFGTRDLEGDPEAY